MPSPALSKKLFLLHFDHSHQPNELAKAVSQAVHGEGSDDEVLCKGCGTVMCAVFSSLTARPSGVELLRLMACSVRDFGVESIFTRGSASGDWQQRQHPSDLMPPLPPAPLPAFQHDAGDGGGADDADQSSVESSAHDAQTRHSAEYIAAVTARVLRQRGVDEATICDAVRTPKLRSSLDGFCFTHQVTGVR